MATFGVELRKNPNKICAVFASCKRRNKNANSNSGLNSDRAKDSASKNGSSRKSGGRAVPYEYPSLNLQDPESGIQGQNGDDKIDESHPIVLVDSKETQIIAYLDQTTPPQPPHQVNYTYDYSSDFVLGDSSHRGLGFGDESEATTNRIESSSKQMEEQEGASCLSSSENEMDADHGDNSKLDAEVFEEGFANVQSSKKNSGFLSIGGVKLYTEDMSDVETDEDYDGESLDDESSETTDQEEQDGLYESDTSESLSDDDSDIDEDVAEDYIEGIGGDDSVLDTKWLVGQALEESDDDSSSSSSFDETLEKLGGIALQDASMEYGVKKYKSRKKYNGGANDIWSSALDDLMLVKDPRTVSGKKKPAAKFPQSWPLQEQKSKNSRRLPGK
ncbi:putative zinc finger protein [Corchorus olitorius]|uniref:Zinc finger protein n=1 Tax=Corchorus olitorius TaxID=93759 RepID=A0A1R3ID12_9ROSI|nr:putative zinc finger protein [Corchorus olitorius]